MQRGSMKFYKQIFLFNRRAFIAAAIVVIACIIVLCFFHLNTIARWGLVIAIAGTIYLSVGSLFFSYLIYDVSDLYRYI